MFSSRASFAASRGFASRVRSSALVAGGLTAGLSLTYATSSPAFCEPSSSTHQSPSKPSIYDEEKRVIIAELPPTRLEKFVEATRERADFAYDMARLHSQLVVDRWIELEQAVESRIKRTIPESDKFLPGAMYVTVAGLAGLVVSRNRGFLLRFTTPLAFAAASAFYFMPGTANNVAKELAEKYVDPMTVNKVVDAKKEVCNLSTVAVNKVEGAVKQVREMIDEKRT
ncbi:hypothetical protein GQ42DRAFT_164744 [Ramicandelaber brevisporus]|nr:hypothetical protein GQ42DRAFT_164744 [Ramicandelaber brevisporus]